MEYGLIGKKLTHSFSAAIHTKLNKADFKLVEVAEDELDSFMTERQFKAINVTMPYKEMVIKHLRYVDEGARQIGAVNTVVNRGGDLYGYNTDFSGMIKMLDKFGISLEGRKVAILGTGGTSKTAAAVARRLGAATILKTSRGGSPSNSCEPDVSVISYDELYGSHTDVDVIINTTPVGMFPNAFDAPIDLTHFKNLNGVADCVYNPLSTRLICQARSLGINACGGLYMLVAQAIYASAIFHDTEYGDEVFDSIYERLLQEKQSIALIGMPSCGKTTVGKRLSEELGLNFIDVDDAIIRTSQMPIPEIFEKNGEKYFRELESAQIKEASLLSGAIIANGGGAILDRENVENLKLNAKIVFIDRPLEQLICTSDRPLSSSREALEKRYAERYPLYRKYADVIIDGSGTVEETVEKIKSWLKRN